MATVVDSLVLELGIDPAKFTKGQKDAVEAMRKFEAQAVTSGKNIEAQNAKINEAFSDIKKQALELTAIFLGGRGIKEFTSFVTNMDAATGRASKTINTSVRDLSAWQSAAEQMGGAAGDVTGAMQGTTQAMNTFLLTGQASFLPVLNRLGIGLFRQNGQLKTSAELYLDLARAMEGVDPARARAFLAMVPGMNETTTNMILQGRAALERLVEAGRQAGGTTAASAAAAAEYNRQLALLDRSATSVGRTLLGFVLPALTRVAEEFAKFLQGKKLDLPAGAAGGGIGPAAGGTVLGVIGNWLAGKGGTSLAGDLQALRADTALRRAGGAGAAPGGSGGQEGGISVKPGAGASSPFTSSVMSALSGVGGISRVTSLNDQFHQGLGGQHPLGQALDLSIKDPSQAAQVTAAIRAALAGAGIDASVTNEYANPSGHATAGHIHIGAGAAAAGVVNNTSSSSRGGDTNSTHIGSITIHAEGGDADGIAGGVGAAIARRNLAVPFNTGQQ